MQINQKVPYLLDYSSLDNKSWPGVLRRVDQPRLYRTNFATRIVINQTFYPKIYLIHWHQ